jgi:hypothetical protein
MFPFLVINKWMANSHGDKVDRRYRPAFDALISALQRTWAGPPSFRCISPLGDYSGLGASKTPPAYGGSGRGHLASPGQIPTPSRIEQTITRASNNTSMAGGHTGGFETPW